MNKLKAVKKKYSDKYFDHSVDALTDNFFVELHAGDDYAPSWLPISFPTKFEFVAYLRYHELSRLGDDLNEDEVEERDQISLVEGKLDNILNSAEDVNVDFAVELVHELFKRLKDPTYFTVHGELKELVVNSDLLEETLRLPFVADWAESGTTTSHGFQSLYASYQVLFPQLKTVFATSNFDSAEVRKVLSKWLSSKWNF